MSRYQRPAGSRGCCLAPVVASALALVALFGICAGIISLGNRERDRRASPATKPDAVRPADHDDEKPPPEAVGGYQTRLVVQNGKTVHVKGYYRKDGTWVNAHDRRPPRR